MTPEIDIHANKSFKEAGYLRKTAAGFSDAILTIILFTVLYIYKEPGFLYEWLLAINPTLAVFIGFILYRLITLILFNGTIGMYLANIKLLNAEQKHLSFLERFFAAFFILYRGINYYNR